MMQYISVGVSMAQEVNLIEFEISDVTVMAIYPNLEEATPPSIVNPWHI